MFTTITRTTLLLCLSAIFSPLLAQPAPTPPPGEVEVTGKLVEAGSGEPLPYATVAVYDREDSTMVTNALTDLDGAFAMDVPPGDYYAVFNFVGFEDKVIPDLNIAEGEGSLGLGEVVMRSDAVLLEQVEVRAERSQMEFKLDRRVFNVGKDLTNAGNSAADILDKVPSVSVDPEGNVSLRGSQSVRILVNGKPSGLLSAGETEALLRMQGDIIESIEVITNPSARYEAEGEAGIINIILKKNQERGFNGSFGATVGYPANFGASYNLNYRQQDFNFFSNFGMDYRRFPGGGNSTQRFYDGGMLTSAYNAETDQFRGGLGGYMQLGADWTIDDRNTLTSSLLLRLGEDDNDAEITYRDLDGDQNVLNTTIRDAMEVEKERNVEASLNYTRTFEQPDREWTFVFKYILDDETELADYRQTSTDATMALLQRSSNTEDEINTLIQTDYIHPFGENSRLEAGLRAAIRVVDNDFLVEEEEDGEFAALPSFDDRLKYNENIYAAYLIGGHEFGAFSLQGGLRAELSDITATLVQSDQSNKQDYINLFPSVSVSYSLSEEQQIQLSYSRRLSRPYFRRLLPFSNFNDPRNNSVGNPNLRPEYTDSYEAGYLYYLPKGTLLTSVYYRHTTGVIDRLNLPNPDGTSIRYPVNLGVRDAYGFEFNLNYNFTDWWQATTDINLFRAITTGSFEGVDYSADAFSWSGRINTRVDVSDRFQVQASFDYDGPRNTTQGRRLAIYTLDMAASLDVFDGKGTFTLSGRDLFNSRKWRNIVDLPNYESESVFQWRRSQQVVLTFSYRLNQDERQARRGERGDDPFGGGGGEGR